MRGNKIVRLITLLLVVAIAAGLWYYGDKNDNTGAKTAAIVAGGAALVGTGLEVADKDFDLKKLWETGSLKKSLMARDKDGNLLHMNEICDAEDKGFYNYNCKDFLTQQEAQEVFDHCGGKDVYGLDRDKDGIVCEALPKKKI